MMEAPTRSTDRRSGFQPAAILARGEGWMVLAFLIATVVLLSILSPVFLTVGNLSNVLDQSVFVLLVAVGVTFVLVTGGIDLSVGSVMGVSAAVSGVTLSAGVPVLIAILIGLFAGGLMGMVNGLIITYLGVPDFIATLAMLSLGRGLVEFLHSREPIRIESEFFAGMWYGSVVGVPVPIIIAAVVTLTLGLVLRQTWYGRQLFLVGVSERAAHLAGVGVNGVRVSVYVVSGLLAGLAGILLAARLVSVQAAHGEGYLLLAIAAAVVGGASLAGGKGTITGVAIAAVLISVVNNGIRLLGISAFWVNIVLGTMILLAVLLDRSYTRFLARYLNKAAESESDQLEAQESKT